MINKHISKQECEDVSSEVKRRGGCFTCMHMAASNSCHKLLPALAAEEQVTDMPKTTQQSCSFRKEAPQFSRMQALELDLQGSNPDSATY
jgi:hypothetical protein